MHDLVREKEGDGVYHFTPTNRGSPPEICSTANFKSGGRMETTCKVQGGMNICQRSIKASLAAFSIFGVPNIASTPNMVRE
jgi:hypothetical protein